MKHHLTNMQHMTKKKYKNATVIINVAEFPERTCHFVSGYFNSGLTGLKCRQCI